MIRLVIADDQAVVRAGLSVILGAEEDIEVVGEAADGAEAIALARELRPDVVCMDIRMPGCTASIRSSVGVLMLGPGVRSGEHTSGASPGELTQDPAGDVLVQGSLPCCDGADRSQKSVLIGTLEEKPRGTGLEGGQDVVVNSGSGTQSTASHVP